MTKKLIDGKKIEKDGRAGSSRLSFAKFSGKMGEWEKGERSFIDSKVIESLWADDFIHKLSD